MSDSPAHHCGLTLVRLRRDLGYYRDRYEDPAWGLRQVYLLLEKQHNRGQDGAGIAVVKFDMPPGEPFLKLIVLNPSERFRFADACLFPPSAAFLLVLATILLLDVGTSGQLKATSAKILETLADHVEGNVTTELRDMRDELGRYDRRVAESCLEQLDQVELLNDPQALRAPSGYWDLRQIFWLGASGRRMADRGGMGAHHSGRMPGMRR